MARASAPDCRAIRKVGGAAAWLGNDSILVPSARAEGVNFVVFVDVQEPDLLLDLINSEPVEEAGG